MKLKKLTVAAMLAVGISTMSFASAMAACPCNKVKEKAPCEKDRKSVV